MAVTLLGSVNAILMIASRTPWAMADDGLLPRFASRVNAGGTPHFSLAASAVATIALVLSGTFETVLALSAFFYVLQYAATFASLFVLRRREPDTPRPVPCVGISLDSRTRAVRRARVHRRELHRRPGEQHSRAGGDRCKLSLISDCPGNCCKDRRKTEEACRHIFSQLEIARCPAIFRFACYPPRSRRSPSLR